MSSNMKSVNKTAARVLDYITKGLEVDSGRRINNSETYMYVSVNRLMDNLYSVSHYYEQNGDLVPDPDMTFYKLEGHPDFGGNQYYPASFQNSLVYQEAIHFGPDGEPASFNPRLQSQLVSFANDWMKAIKNQQGLKIPAQRRRRK